MKNMNCEDFLIQKMALLDGEKAGVSAEQITAHFANCENCREQIAEFENTTFLLRRQKRREQSADLWSAIEKEIGAESKKSLPIKWHLFAILGAFLVIYKFWEMIPERDFGWVLRPIPFILVAAVFVLLKENPFKINTELSLEK